MKDWSVNKAVDCVKATNLKMQEMQAAEEPVAGRMGRFEDHLHSDSVVAETPIPQVKKARKAPAQLRNALSVLRESQQHRGSSPLRVPAKERLPLDQPEIEAEKVEVALRHLCDQCGGLPEIKGQDVLDLESKLSGLEVVLAQQHQETRRLTSQLYQNSIFETQIDADLFQIYGNCLCSTRSDASAARMTRSWRYRTHICRRIQVLA